MKQLPLVLVATLLSGLAACSVRSVEDEEPPPDIEGLCHDFCARVLECDLSPNAEFDTMDGCTRACSSDARWGPGCTETLEELYLCQNRFDCPEFPQARAEQCEPETLAYSNCDPEEHP